MHSRWLLKNYDHYNYLFCISVFCRGVALYIKILIKLHFFCSSILKKEREREIEKTEHRVTRRDVIPRRLEWLEKHILCRQMASKLTDRFCGHFPASNVRCTAEKQLASTLVPQFNQDNVKICTHLEFSTSELLLYKLQQSNLYRSFKCIQTILHMRQVCDLMHYTHFNKAFFTFNMS